MDKKKLAYIIFGVCGVIVVGLIVYFVVLPMVNGPKIPEIEAEDYVDPEGENPLDVLPGDDIFAEPTGDAWADDSLGQDDFVVPEAIVSEEDPFDINDMMPGGDSGIGGGDDELQLPPSAQIDPVVEETFEQPLQLGYFDSYVDVIRNGINGLNLSATDLYNIEGTTATFKDGDIELYLSIDPNTEAIKASYTFTFDRDTYTNPDSITRVFGLLFALRGEVTDAAGKDDYQIFKNAVALPVNFSGLQQEYGNGVDVKVEDTLVRMEAESNGTETTLHMYMTLPKVRLIESRTQAADSAAVPNISDKPSTGRWED